MSNLELESGLFFVKGPLEEFYCGICLQISGLGVDNR